MSDVQDKPLAAPVEVSPRDERELAIARLIDAPAEALYRCWTDPRLIPEWFCPKPWTTEVLEMDVRPGGVQALMMRGPNGEAHPAGGVYLELIPGRKVVFTSALGADWRPNPGGDFPFVGQVTFEPQADGRTLYTARAAHWELATAEKHREMGFHEGWGICAEQMAALARTL